MCNNTKIYHENLTIMCFCTLFDIPFGRGQYTSEGADARVSRCVRKTRISSDHFRSENFASKMAKPFVSGHFSKGRKWSEIGRKIFGKYSFSIDKHQKTFLFTLLTNSTFRQFDNSTIRQKGFLKMCERDDGRKDNEERQKYMYIYFILYIYYNIYII